MGRRLFILTLFMAFHLISLNVNGLRDADKRAGLLQWLRSLPSTIDIVCLQECHCSSEIECQDWFRSSGFASVVSPGSARSCGVIVLYRPLLTVVNSWNDSDGRVLLVEFSFRDSVFRICSVYAPNRNPVRDQFFDDLIPQIDPSVPTILAGDFNAVFDRLLDRVGSSPDDTSRESSVALCRLFDACCVEDVWRYLHPSSSSFTWARWDHSCASRIDHFGVPYAWVPSVSSCDIVPCPFSDHCALLLSFSIPEVVPHGPGLWKFNVSILEDDDYVALISDFWSSWRRRSLCFPSLAQWWDAGKSKIKGLTISFCSNRSKKRNFDRDLLSRLAGHLKAQVDLGRVSSVGPYRSTLNCLKDLDLEAARGAQIRSRIRWVEEGESSSAYFFRLEKKLSVDRHIAALRAADGSLVSSSEDLCRVFSSFYQDLFTSVPCDPVAQSELFSNVTSCLSCDDNLCCEGLLTPSECLTTLRGMAHGKAPGCDGLPMEFYVKFWPVLGDDLVRVFNSSFSSGLLSSSQRRGVISLSYKKGDRLDPRNWRPITLLNVDYKIASRAIAARLLKVLHLVVERDQSCGVPGRFIGENVVFLRDVVHFCSSSGVPAAILSLDQEKAFDRVDWHFLRSTLVTMGFGPSFIQWVMLFYSDVQSAVNVNGHISSFFFLSRGVRQGCPLSPLLYILVAEVLACTIRANPHISGLSLPGFLSPLPCISQYADDTSLIVGTERAIEEVFNVYSLYERGSGAKLNPSKCEGLWLGPWNGRTDSPINIIWSSVKIKVLGVFLGPGNLDEINWRPRITSVENALNSWRQRSLSYRGRALVINALALSRVWYVASLIPVPPWVLSELTSLVFKFFWSGKRDLVARMVVCQPSFLGGFSVVDCQAKLWALRVQWVRRFVISPASWSSFLIYWFSTVFAVPPQMVFSYPFFFAPDSLPPFYRELVFAWRACNGSFTSGSLGIGAGIDFCNVCSVTTKSVYLYLLSERFVSPHCEVKFYPLFGSLYWSSTWRQLFFFDLDRPVIDLCWKVAHGVLYTAERLSSFGYDLSTVCFCGHPLESLQHLFFDCPLASSVWDWVQSLLFSVSSLYPTLLPRHVLFGFSSDELRCVPRFFVYVINVCKFVLWIARNDFRFRDVRPSAVHVIESVKSRVRFYLPLFFRRFQSFRRRRYFVRQWGARGVFCSLIDNRLVVHL